MRAGAATMIAGLASSGAIVGACLGVTMSSPGTAQADTYYCQQVVSAGYECPQHANVTGDNENQGYFQTRGLDYVCERVTVTYHAANASYDCGPSPEASGCDLSGYSLSTEFSMYVDNDIQGTLAEYLTGKAYDIASGQCIPT
jgi:hypothetical protein